MALTVLPPHSTPVPDVLFDLLLRPLTGNELKVLLYLIRRTYGFGKQADAIALSQFREGIKTADGRQLDSGCGIGHNRTILSALQGLEKKGLLRAFPQEHNRPTIYALSLPSHVVTPGNHLLVTSGNQVVTPSNQQVVTFSPQVVTFSPQVVTPGNTQETVIQETVIQETDSSLFTRPDADASGAGHASQKESLEAFVLQLVREEQAAACVTGHAMLEDATACGYSEDDVLSLLTHGTLHVQNGETVSPPSETQIEASPVPKQIAQTALMEVAADTSPIASDSKGNKGGKGSKKAVKPPPTAEEEAEQHRLAVCRVVYEGIVKRRGGELQGKDVVVEKTYVKKLVEAGATPEQIDEWHRYLVEDDWRYNKPGDKQRVTATVLWKERSKIILSLADPEYQRRKQQQQAGGAGRGAGKATPTTAGSSKPSNMYPVNSITNLHDLLEARKAAAAAAAAK